MQKSRNLTAFLIAWNTNAKVHQHQGLSNKLALPGTFEKQLSRSTMLNRLTVNRIRSQSGRIFDLNSNPPAVNDQWVGAMTSDTVVAATRMPALHSLRYSLTKRLCTPKTGLHPLPGIAHRPSKSNTRRRAFRK